MFLKHVDDASFHFVTSSACFITFKKNVFIDGLILLKIIYYESKMERT
jgi:hypothetical protein